MRRLAVVTLAVLIPGTACSRTVVTSPPAGDASASGMVVTGIGRVEARPDTLVVSLGVESTAGTAPAALADVSEKARALLEAVRGEGVAQREIATEALSVRPDIEEGNIVGYIATERFRIRVLELERAGAVVAAAVRAAGDDARVSDMSLEVEDPERARQQARALAVQDALARARELAEAAGVALGPPIAIEESRAPTFERFPLPFGDTAVTGAAAFASLAPEIEPGTQEIEVRVQVRFGIG